TGRLDPAERYISHFPEENLVMSFSSNYGGNALLGKKCFALRLASVLARDEGWLAEHMLILGLTDPAGRKTWIAAAFPSACGKTNLAMLVPPPQYAAAGWKIETVGDDIAWLSFGRDGRLYAINPENGFFGVAPGTSAQTNPNALAACRANTIFTNVALKPDGSVWWEGLEPPPPQAIDWLGNAWTPSSGHKAAHPNSRFTAPAAQCPCISPEWENPRGVPIDAIIVGGRRSTTAPLVYQACDWQHGTYIAATMTSEKTAAAAGNVGELRHDPMAMLPFCGYHMADYWQHWLDMGRRGGAKMPAVFHVNWFRKDGSGRYLWPGFGENIRVLQWIAARSRGEGTAVETPVGWLPAPDAVETRGLDICPAVLRELLKVDPEEWRAEHAERTVYFQQFGDKLPAGIREEHEALDRRLP
ncbi:MAG: phosphoenolpyruvate carboxykinase (GTP), partial [Planctomycetes bacterium]|nr:phosphoenolpyruvate carboxykinase (GTP) [Planctomycetota bacterium]